MSKSVVLGLCAPLLLVLAGTMGCGSSSTNDNAADAGTGAVDASPPPVDASPGDGGSSGPLGFTPSNVPLDQLDFTGTEDIDIAKNDTFEPQILGAASNPASFKYFEIVPAAGPKLGVFLVKSLRIEESAVVTIAKDHAIVIIAQDFIDVRGSLVAAASHDTTVGGGFMVANATRDVAGVGPGGGGAGSASTSPGGGGFCTPGGSGATISGGTPAAGGATFGTAALVPLFGGASGGTGIGNGGAGGGAIELVAKNAITVTGVINVNGGGGAFGGSPLDQSAGGGGSGGAILLEAASVTVSGKLFANGGGGGATSSTAFGENGHEDTTPALGGGAGAGAGGAGASGASPAAAPGVAGDATNGPMSSGGGGGGVGRIRMNTRSGSAAFTGQTSACVTQGSLTP